MRVSDGPMWMVRRCEIDRWGARWPGHEVLAVIAAQAPGLRAAVLAAKMAGYAHVNIDGKLIETDRCRTPGPTAGWISGGREA
jgi:hypothetical protein